MRGFDALRSDLTVLRGLLRGMPREGDHAQRLAGFYGAQAAHYDAFRDRLLPGRAELIASLDLPPRARIIELGGGTGRNLEFFPRSRRADLQFEIVDLCEPLLAIARHRTLAWPQVRITHADATRYQPAQTVDIVLLSYALTMIPDWRAALDNAIAMLRPGGQLAVVDFHVSSADPPPWRARHGALARAFWPRWFRHDGVHLDPAHLEALRDRLPWHRLHEGRARLPWLPGLRVPYYRFIGRRGD
ncbi:class I SAM-dependent methyltransferase [Aquimonas voraii]|uniref:S-adenosylmethionine-diacylgycerolhomoserine-N-methlytransferase n=1 Tax=Aquimonas voraii TaxID=265719 RepID=A0A1G6V1B7_9GAMM|nr:class I SAM-dependent methyltransferase [Aquimonas voraii]SDD47410.1 S-adenosylmethionine-diacylgycerolhomoserine-N-methlytransferase [Aquimonas voraii]